MDGGAACINQTNCIWNGNSISVTVIKKNEVLEQMGRSSMKNRVRSTDLYFTTAWVGPLRFSVANGRKLFDSFTHAHGYRCLVELRLPTCQTGRN